MEKSNIQWTGNTVNFWMGCKKVSPACKYCYLYRIMAKNGGDGSTIKRVSDATFYKSLYWKQPTVIFTCSMSDFFLPEADAWREDAWDVIRRTPQHTWQILTKRPERIAECLPPDWGAGWDNVWLGVSVENQEYFKRVAILNKIPAKIRFISAEPLLEEIDFLAEIDGKRVIDSVQWVIIGGESGNSYGPYGYRPSEISWYERAINDLKQNTSAAVFNKQLGCYLRDKLKLKHYHGGEMNEWPENLRVREFPVENISFNMM
jgi:protein gp37